MFEVFKNVPVPAHKSAAQKYNFEGLNVGDMIFVPDPEPHSTPASRSVVQGRVSAAASMARRRLNMTFRTASCQIGGRWGIGVWRVT